MSKSRGISAQVEETLQPDIKEIAGVSIYMNGAAPGLPAYEWTDILEEWLPRFDEHGLLEGMERIMVDENIVPHEGTGEYYSTGSIYLEKDPKEELVDAICVGEGAEVVLTHELMHHIHMGIKEYRVEKHWVRDEYIRRCVSEYAQEDPYEAVAEIGNGIIHGYDFPERVMEYYERHNGPMEVFDI